MKSIDLKAMWVTGKQISKESYIMTYNGFEWQLDFEKVKTGLTFQKYWSTKEND